jgi:hypothetical protein
MNPPEAARPSQPPTPRNSQLLAAIIFFLLGVSVTVLWFNHAAAGRGSGVGLLSVTTSNALAHLSAPVSVRCYALLSVNADPQTQAYAGRAVQLLRAMQGASGGKLRLTTLDTPAEANANAASADGLQAFNLDKGESDFLGITVASGTNRETLARLDPAWEPALEDDVVRAILRVAAPAAAAPQAPEVARPSSEIMASIHRLIPDVSATSAETANQIFHAEFMKELAAASGDMGALMNAAQQRVTSAQTNGSPAELDAAQKNLTQVQLAQSAKIRKFAAELKTWQEVFQNLKDSDTNAAKSSGN